MLIKTGIKKWYCSENIFCGRVCRFMYFVQMLQGGHRGMIKSPEVVDDCARQPSEQDN